MTVNILGEMLRNKWVSFLYAITWGWFKWLILDSEFPTGCLLIAAVSAKVPVFESSRKWPDGG